MTINPLHLNGMMQRSQDVSTLKQNEEQRPVVQQENIQVSFSRKSENMVKTVTNPEEKQKKSRLVIFILAEMRLSPFNL